MPILLHRQISQGMFLTINNSLKMNVLGNMFDHLFLFDETTNLSVLKLHILISLNTLIFV